MVYMKDNWNMIFRRHELFVKNGYQKKKKKKKKIVKKL